MILAQTRLIHAQATTIQTLEERVIRGENEVRGLRQRLESAEDVYRKANVDYEAVLDELSFFRDHFENQGDKPSATTSAPPAAQIVQETVTETVFENVHEKETEAVPMDVDIQESQAQVKGDSSKKKRKYIVNPAEINMEIEPEMQWFYDEIQACENTDEYMKMTDEEKEEKKEEEEEDEAESEPKVDLFKKKDGDDDDKDKGEREGRLADDKDDDDDQDDFDGDSGKQKTSTLASDPKKGTSTDAEAVRDFQTDSEAEIPTSEAFTVEDDGFIREEPATGKDLVVFVPNRMCKSRKKQLKKKNLRMLLLKTTSTKKN